MTRPGFPGGSKPWRGWSHGEEGIVRVRPKEPDNCIGTSSLPTVLYAGIVHFATLLLLVMLAVVPTNST